ncbi:MAG: hypothetical protein ACRDTJ_33045 [Pseudonocardiaceae bacterium]
MKVDPVDWLVQEVTDLLDASSVGLYEFMLLLRGAYPERSESELRFYAANALKRLRETGCGDLVSLKWPAEDVVQKAIPEEPQPADWESPDEGGEYLAIARN